MGVRQKDRSPGPAFPAGEKLDSWKAIAAHLGRDPRTVQMWEKAEGFPVHRLNHNARPSVYAYTTEIDDWMQARSGERKPAAFLLEPGEEEQRTSSMRVTPKLIAVLGLLICLGFLGAWIIGSRRAATQARAGSPKLAVLPFDDQTSVDDSAGDRLTDAVIADLGRIGHVPVVAWQSVEPFRGRRLRLDQVAAELKVPLLLRGTVAQVGNEIQVTVELLGEPGDVHQWGFTYTREATAATADAIAWAVATDVAQRIAGGAPPASARGPVIDPRARQDYLTGRFYWNQRDLDGLQKAIVYYEKALSIEPRYAEAYNGLAEAYDLMPDHGVMSAQEAFQRAKQAAQKALGVDPGSGEAYSALAFAVYRQDWDFVRAEQYFRKAIALAPDSAVAHQWYGEFLGDMRRFDESLAELRTARNLDPLSPMVSADLADGYLHAERATDAEAELDRVLDLYPNFQPAHLYQIALRQQQGDLKAAMAEAQIYLEGTGDKVPLRTIAIRQLLAAGKTEEARQAARQLIEDQGGEASSAYLSAQLLFATGQNEEGYAALERAYHEHSWWLVTMLVDPGFKAVRDQSRFLSLVHRVGLPVEAAPTQIAMAP